MKTLLDFLFAFFRIGVDAEDEEPQVELELAEETPAAEEEQEEPGPEEEEVDPKRELTAAQTAAKTERERADRYERELIDERRRRVESTLATQRPPEDETTREENSRLSDPKTTDLEKWQIQANRQLRQGRNDSQMALAQAHDVADKTTFASIAVTSPALYKRYAARVEEKLADMRAKGYNAPREAILDNMIGKDAREGKLTRKAKPAASASTETVARGKLPGVRSDVSGRGKMTEHQKREQRLLNVAI